MKYLALIKNKLKELGKMQIIYICVLSLVFSVCATTLNYIVESHRKTMVLTLNYDKAKEGLTPLGGRFNIASIKSDDVLDDTIRRLENTSLTTDFLKTRIDIEAKTPKTAMDKTISSIQTGSVYSYPPAEFTIAYSQKNKFGRNDTIKVLEALSESYTKYFNENYCDNNAVLDYSRDLSYENYDYDEICVLLNDKVNSMISYLSGQRKENITFVSNQTGYSYIDLINKLNNIRDVNIVNLRAYIMQNEVSKDKSLLLKKYDYMLDSETMKFDYLNNSSNIVKTALLEYDAAITGVAFIPSIDENSEYYMGRTKTGLDNLVKKSYSDGARANSIKKTIDEYDNISTIFSGSESSSDEQIQTAENMIGEIKSLIADVSELAIKTDDEYLEIMTNKYLSFKMPTKSTVSITYFIKMLIIGLILFYALHIVLLLCIEWFKKYGIKIAKEVRKI